MLRAALRPISRSQFASQYQTGRLLARRTWARRATMAAAAASSPQHITFYDSGNCPYAHRTWLALEEKALQYDTIIVDLKNKSKARVLPLAHSSCCDRSW